MLAQIHGSVNASSRALEEIAAVAASASSTSFAAIAARPLPEPANASNVDGAPIRRQPGADGGAGGKSGRGSTPVIPAPKPPTTGSKPGPPASGDADGGEDADGEKDDDDEPASNYNGCFAKGQLLEIDAAPGEAGGWSVLRNYSEDALYLAVPLEQLSRPFTVIATAGRVSGLEASILHYGVGVDDSLFHLRVHPHKPRVDIVRPQLNVRAGSTAYAAAQREGNADIGWTAELRAAACTRLDVNGTRVEQWPPSSRTSNATYVMVNALDWVMSGMSIVELGDKCDKRKLRLVKARAFERNLQFVLTCGKLAEKGSDDDADASSYLIETPDAPMPAIEYHFSLAYLPGRPPRLYESDGAASVRGDEPAADDEASAASDWHSLYGDAMMVPRRADDRVGYFGQSFVQIGPLPGALEGFGSAADAAREEEMWAASVNPLSTVSDVTRADADQTVNIINRWRLLKARPGLPAGELSPPVKPITFHIDPTVPRALWEPVSTGVLAWNEAFEAIGFQNALVVLTPDSPAWPLDYDAGDIRFSSITWLPYPSLGLAVGPTHVDPRTGEILYANIVFGEGWIAALRGSWYDSATLGRGGEGAAGVHSAHEHKHERGGHHACHMSASVPLAHLHARLVAQGALAVGQPVPDQFVRQGLHDIVAHEVGHTLGLRHNFKASGLFTIGEVHAQSNASGIVAASVMDYLAPVVAEDKAEQGIYFMRRIGPYDKWAIKYGYSDLSGATRDERHAALLAIAAELGARPRELQRADDTDTLVGNDAATMPYDFSADPLEWCESEERALKRVVGALGAWTDAPSRDTVWLRQYERLLLASRSTIGRFWDSCTEVVRRHASGLSYDRSNRDELSKPLPPARRARALERACAMLQDDELAVVPRALMARSASFDDAQTKWGLLTPYDRSLQLGLARRVRLMGALASPAQLRWVDTLAWLERGAPDGPASQPQTDAGPAPAGAGAEALLLPWYAELPAPAAHAASPSVRSAAHALAKLTSCILAPLLAGEPRVDPDGGGYELARATQSAWVDMLSTLHLQASNGSLSIPPSGSKLPDLGQPFNAQAVRAGTEAILHGLSDRLDELVGGAERPPRGANSTAYFASGLRRVVRAALREDRGPSAR